MSGVFADYESVGRSVEMQAVETPHVERVDRIHEPPGDASQFSPPLCGHHESRLVAPMMTVSVVRAFGGIKTISNEFVWTVQLFPPSVVLQR